MSNSTNSRLFFLLAKYLPSYAMRNAQEQIERSNISEQQLAYATIEMKDPTIAIILSVLVGEFGIDRFYIGDVGLGVAKLLTCGGLGIWWLIDLFLIMDKTREKNYQMLMQMTCSPTDNANFNLLPPNP